MITYPPQKFKSASFLQRLVDAQSNLCHYCKEPFGLPEHEANPTRDHIVPKANGGTNQPHNFVAACARCNHAKGTLTAGKFISLIADGKLPARRNLAKSWASKVTRNTVVGAALGTFGGPACVPIKAQVTNPPNPKLAVARVVNPPFSKNPPLKRIYQLEDLARDWDEDRFATPETDAAAS